ncbi:MAG: 3',5'-cyclic-nucleotide phosphodiesterase [Deltaproteobacteria bacterium]|nr:3',5'-cyclic-nucleotide phosphodiesterase [Deltaproteobacteria bacterium]
MVLRVEVLGAAGGETPEDAMTSFTLGESLALDAGGLTRSLHLEAQLALDAVLVTHAHLDHVRDLATLADTRAQRRAKPLTVYGLAVTLRALAQHLFNGQLWPDFTRLPSPRKPALRFVEVRPGEVFRAGGLSLSCFPVHHSIDTVGVVARSRGRAVLFSGDTGPTDRLWTVAQDLGRDLRAVFVECSFPRRLARLAEISGHLSPDTLAGELAKLGSAVGRIPIFTYHMKPGFSSEIEAEVHDLLDGVVLARPGLVVRTS